VPVLLHAFWSNPMPPSEFRRVSVDARTFNAHSVTGTGDRVGWSIIRVGGERPQSRIQALLYRYAGGGGYVQEGMRPCAPATPRGASRGGCLARTVVTPAARAGADDEGALRQRPTAVRLAYGSLLFDKSGGGGRRRLRWSTKEEARRNAGPHGHPSPDRGRG